MPHHSSPAPDRQEAGRPQRPTGSRPVRIALASLASLALVAGATALPAHATAPTTEPTDVTTALEPGNGWLPESTPGDVDQTEAIEFLTELDGLDLATPGQTGGEAPDPLSSDARNYAAALEALSRTTDTSFYETPDTLPAENGALIRQEAAQFYLDPVRLVRVPAKVVRYMYTTLDSTGTQRPAVATVLEPRLPTRGERKVVVHAPGTQGAADRCAPSRQLAAGTEYEAAFIKAALQANYTVVVVDYIGLGTEGVHTYLNRVDQGNAVLDAARAVTDVQGLDLTEQSPIVIRGYSQGGGAAAAALETAHEYAPEVNVVGGSVGAVPANLTDVATSIDSTLYTAFLLFALPSLAESYGIDASEFLNARGLERMERAQDQCLVDALLSHAFVDTSTLTNTGESFTELVQQAPFDAIAAEQNIGFDGRFPTVPVHIHHSRLDDVIPYQTGRDLGGRWCALGATVEFDSNIGPGHMGGFVAGTPSSASFTSKIFDGKRPTNSCYRL